MKLELVTKQIETGEALLKVSETRLAVLTTCLGKFKALVSTGADISTEILEGALAASEDVGRLKENIFSTKILLNALKEKRERIISEQTLAN